jgi:copper chaperone
MCPGALATGVESFDVSLKEQKVVVKGNVTPEAVLATVSKTGKKAELVQ